MKYPAEIIHMSHIGWGVKASRPLPKGAFVLELAREILTNVEMILRNPVAPSRPYFAIQLNDDWATQAKLDDNTVLCLDSSLFDNVASFENHTFVIKHSYALMSLFKLIYSYLMD